jgi:hypothetical protein
MQWFQLKINLVLLQNIYLFLSMWLLLLDHNITNLETFGITIHMFGCNDGLHRPIALNVNYIVPPIMGDSCIMQLRSG